MGQTCSHRDLLGLWCRHLLVTSMIAALLWWCYWSNNREVVWYQSYRDHLRIEAAHQAERETWNRK